MDNYHFISGSLRAGKTFLRDLALLRYFWQIDADDPEKIIQNLIETHQAQTGGSHFYLACPGSVAKVERGQLIKDRSGIDMIRWVKKTYSSPANFATRKRDRDRRVQALYISRYKRKRALTIGIK